MTRSKRLAVLAALLCGLRASAAAPAVEDAVASGVPRRNRIRLT